MQLKGKQALVTGASRGIGKAIAVELGRQGAEVIIHYKNNGEEAEAVLKEVERGGAKGHLLQADLEDSMNAVTLGNNAWNIAGRIDYLINNAGVSYKKHFLDYTIEDFDYFSNINFKSTFLLTQTIAKKMVLNNVEGSIYTVTSINGIQPGAGLSLYGATKGGLETLMRGVALELAPHNITVNTVAVGAVETDMNAALLKDEEKLKLVSANIPMKRIGKPEEVAAVIVGLLQTGTYLTGSSIKIDGGWLLKTGFLNPQRYNSNE